MNFQMFKLDLEKAEEPEIKLPTSVGLSKKQESSRKTSTTALLTAPKPLTIWITELNMEQWTCSKLGKEYIKAVYCHPAYLTYMQNAS